LALVSLAVVATLAMLGPAIGNVFSSIINGL
jgi:Flp pilus assembly pilin Flp